MKRIVIPNRLQGAAIDELGNGRWRIWLHTSDWKHGTYLLLHCNGRVERITETEDDGVQRIVIKPANI